MKKLASNNVGTQKGFTLIELVVVIVILGILAATAVPKFIDLTGDARASVMKGVQGSIYSAVNLAHAKALVSAEIGATGEITIATNNYALVHGFPAAIATATGLGIENLIELDSSTEITVAADGTDMVFTHSGAPTPTACIITYTNAANSETAPEVVATITGC